MIFAAAGFAPDSSYWLIITALVLLLGAAVKRLWATKTELDAAIEREHAMRKLWRGRLAERVLNVSGADVYDGEVGLVETQRRGC